VSHGHPAYCVSLRLDLRQVIESLSSKFSTAKRKVRVKSIYLSYHLLPLPCLKSLSYQITRITSHQFSLLLPLASYSISSTLNPNNPFKMCQIMSLLGSKPCSPYVTCEAPVLSQSYFFFTMHKADDPFTVPGQGSSPKDSSVPPSVPAQTSPFLKASLSYPI
jgi:hypothetical protein